MPDDRSEDLIQRYLEHIASPAEVAELERLVAERTEVADALWDATRVDTLLTLHLHGIHSEMQAGAGLDANHLRGRRLVRAVAAIAALLLVVVILGWSLQGPTGQVAWDAAPTARIRAPRLNAAAYPVVAGMVEVEDIPATRVRSNTPLRVVGDRPAVIELAGGTRAELAVATAAIIRSPDDHSGQVLELLEGGGRFRVPPQGDGTFRVETCSGSVSTLGTDFEVNLWSTEGKEELDMSFRSMFVLAVAVVTGMVHVDVPGEQHVLSAGAQKLFGAEPEKQKDFGKWLPSGDILGFTGKGGEPIALERSVPGIVGALELTTDQKQRIGAAVAETIQSEKVRAAVVLAKLNPNATQEQKEQAQRLVAEARDKLRQLVGQILTDEQKKLVANINAAAEQARREVTDSAQTEQAPDKHDEPAMKRWREQIHQRMDAAVQKRIVAMLTPTQKVAFEQAAAVQAIDEKAAKDQPKRQDKSNLPDKTKQPDAGKQPEKTKQPDAGKQPDKTKQPDRTKQPDKVGQPDVQS